MEAILIINNLTAEKTVVKEEQFGPKETGFQGKLVAAQHPEPWPPDPLLCHAIANTPRD
jgi:hypothetical protein